MRVVFAALIYFAAVFVAAFAFGTVRTLLLEPRIGETLAVACEAPFLVLVIYLAARHVVPRANPPRTAIALVVVGLVGLLFQQIAEFALVLFAGETVASHIAYLGTPAGMIYLTILAVFVAMPFLLLRVRT